MEQKPKRGRKPNPEKEFVRKTKPVAKELFEQEIEEPVKEVEEIEEPIEKVEEIEEPVKAVKEKPVVEKEKPIEIDPDPVILWQKIGGGALHLSKRLIPSGAKFRARVSEIPKAFRDTVVPLEDLPPEPMEAPVEPVKSNYRVVPNEKKEGMFDIVSAEGKKLNEKPLTKEVAEQFKLDLE